MVTGVGLNTGINMAMANPITGVNNSMQTLGITTPNNTYADDIMASRINFSQYCTPIAQQAPGENNPATSLVPNGLTQQTPSQTTLSSQPLPLVQQNQTFTGNQELNEINEDELKGFLVQRDPNIAQTENGNCYKKTNSGKVSGLIAGFLAPMGGKIIDLFKGGSFKQLFKFKQLAIACPAVALAGLGIGALLDGYVNNKKAKAADEAALAQTQQPQQQIQMNTIV